MSEQELTDLEGMDWDIDGGYWYSVANGDVSPDRLLAYTICLRDENAALKRLLQKAENVQEGKMEYSHTFCWWCGGLKHDMTKNAAFYCEGAALLTKEEQT